ncbi:unnamed protein product [Ectocarpus sp. 8 AP-2014]
MLAALVGHSHIVKILLKKGANVPMVDKRGVAALHAGAQEGHVTAVELLAKAGADPDAMTSKGATPLHMAAERGHSEVVRALIEAGANPDSRMTNGGTPLYIAAQGGHLGVMRELLRGKADPLLNQVQAHGSASVALDIAAQSGHSDVVRELNHKRGIQGCDAYNAGKQALRVAASGQHLDVMAILTAAGVVDDGMALLEAARSGCDASIKHLLRQRHKESKGSVDFAYVNTRGPDGHTPLFCGVRWCSPHAPRIVRLLIDAGADATSPIRLTNSKGQLAFMGTPLVFTTSRIRCKVVAFGTPATEEHLHRLEAIRRLLLRVKAVHAVSWLWPTDAFFIGDAAESGPQPPLPPLRLVLPILKRQTVRRGGLAATLVRFSASHKVGRPMLVTCAAGPTRPGARKLFPFPTPNGVFGEGLTALHYRGAKYGGVRHPLYAARGICPVDQREQVTHG